MPDLAELMLHSRLRHYSCCTAGYGIFAKFDEKYLAHRYMCELVNGPAPTPDHDAAHSCGRGHDGCVHPNHLSWKTTSDNLKERRVHGTHVSNRYGNKGLLTDKQVAEIRALKGRKTQYEIADQFGVSRGCIQYWHGLREQRNPQSVR